MALTTSLLSRAISLPRHATIDGLDLYFGEEKNREARLRTDNTDLGAAGSLPLALRSSATIVNNSPSRKIRQGTEEKSLTETTRIFGQRPDPGQCVDQPMDGRRNEEPSVLLRGLLLD